METLAPESTAGTSNARKAGRHTGLPPSSIFKILYVLNQYPYKLQSSHELLPFVIVQREAFAKWSSSKIEQESSWGFSILWTDEGHFSLYGDVNTHNCHIRATLNPRMYVEEPQHSPVSCGFTGSFIIGSIFFETQCPVNGWKTVTVHF
ncbi:DUF4817 domain-containing protein [Trichonephila clavipes]|nr:DUF4817 domain-containing protein [Trichonephila clavipes]